jgi:hypothetical protein
MAHRRYVRRRSIKRTLGVAATLVALAMPATATCTLFPHPLYGERISGQVVDGETGKAIAGAHAAFVWDSPIKPSGFTGHNARDICYHAAATVTDEQGRFTIPSWKEWSRFDVDAHDPTALIYAPRYTARQIPLAEGDLRPPEVRPNERYALRPFTGSVDQRLEVMWWGVANHGCSYGGESQKSLFPMLKAMYEEARRIAVTEEQRKNAYGFSVMAARSALAPNPTGPANVSEIDQFIKERLQ